MNSIELSIIITLVIIVYKLLDYFLFNNPKQLEKRIVKILSNDLKGEEIYELLLRIERNTYKIAEHLGYQKEMLNKIEQKLDKIFERILSK
jgi:hypothetical protein